jgi:hypothetical protein
MRDPNGAVRVGGAWLAIASCLMIATFVLHGPIAPDLHVQMTRIADQAVRWAVVHWMAAAALSLYAVGGLIVLTSGSRLTDGRWTLTAWAVVCVGCLWTTMTAVAETTVVAEAAASASEETFAAWWAFAEGMANGFAFFALAVAVIAGSDARDPAGATPAWSAWIAVAAGIGSFAGWALGMWLGLAIGSLLWVASSIVLSLWTLGFGIALVRTPSAPAAHGTRAFDMAALPF